MKYANIFFDGNRHGSVNIGDDLQLLAIENMYREMGVDYSTVIRIGLSQLTTYDGEYVVLPISFPLYGYRDGLNITMFSPKIIPVFLGLSIMSGNISEEEVCYLKRFEPIGCRDYYTMDLLRRKNIMCYLNGCMTATLPISRSVRGDNIYMVDIPKRYYPFIPEEIREKAIVKSQILQNCDEPEKVVRNLLDEYSKDAKLVITTRLHCAWPCLAMGIPVVLMKDKFSFRFTALSGLLHVYTIDEFEKINWNPDVIFYEDIKKKILDNAKHIITKTFEKYRDMYDISWFYEKRMAQNDVFIEHFDNVIADIAKIFKEDEEISYAVWGITQKSDMICDYMEQHYLKSKLVAVYDRGRKTVFHGVQSTQDINQLLNKECYVFVTAATANEDAKQLFEEHHKTNYHISTDGIGE